MSAVKSVPDTVKFCSVEGTPVQPANAFKDVVETVTTGAVAFDSKLPISLRLMIDTPL